MAGPLAVAGGRVNLQRAHDALPIVQRCGGATGVGVNE
jgi:hypothetical protein